MVGVGTLEYHKVDSFLFLRSSSMNTDTQEQKPNFLNANQFHNQISVGCVCDIQDADGNTLH